MYLLDSNVLIQHIRGKICITDEVARRGEPNCAIPSIVAYEVLYGALRSSRVDQRDQVHCLLASMLTVNFDQQCAEAASNLRYELERRGEVIGPYDLLIAGTALAHDLTLVSHNVAEFSRVPGLKIEDWQAAP